MNHYRYLILAVLICCNPVTAAEPLVILLSWDGMRHDFPDRGNLAGLKRMQTEGIRAGKLIPVYPSNTFPGHVSLATGANPAVHGILDNRMHDREKGDYAYSADANWILAEPLWIAAERQGLKAATFFWVGSETDWHNQRSTYRIAPFSNTTPEHIKVRQIIDWIDLPAPERPALIMSYWSGADSTGHRKGPDHADVATTITAQDEQLQHLLAAIDKRDLWPTTTLIIVSDHGMTKITQHVDLSQIINDSGVAEHVVGGGAVQRIFLAENADPSKLLSALAAIPEINVLDRTNNPGITMFTPASRAGDIIITTTPPRALRYNDGPVSRVTRIITDLIDRTEGTHGFNPRHEDMAGIFLAMGRGVKPGKQIAEIKQIEVAGTVTRLLGIEPPLQAESPGISLD